MGMETTYSFSTSAETGSPEEMANMLERIAGLIREGHSSGYEPYWTMLRTEAQ